MTSSTMFASDEKKQTIRRWADDFLRKVAVPTEEVVVQTTFGATHARIAGPSDAPPLVLLHGALASSAHVLPEIGSLVQKRRVYAIDVVGQSVLSEDRRIDVRDDSYGRWLVEACDGLGLDRFDLFGVSWGGFVALRGAITAPERLWHLVLLTPAGVVAGPAWAGFRDVGWPMFLYRAFPSQARLERVVRGIFTTLDPDWTAYFGEAVRSYRFDMRTPPLARPEELSKVRCPTLVFGADADVSFPGAALLARVKELLPHAEVEMIEGSKHCPPLTDEFRARLAARVERFLAEG